MKKESKKTNNKNLMKTIKILTIISLIVLISMIGFFGIYKQNKNQMSNVIKEHSYSMALNGTRTIKLQLSTNTTKIVKDNEGNIIEGAKDEEIKEKGYTTEEIPNNKEEDKTVENYKKTKKIIENRLNYLKIEEYNVSLNEKTGEITIEIPEDSKADIIVSKLATTGKFEIIDTETKEVLLDNNNIKSSDVLYNTSTNGTTVYLEIAFNKEGKQILENISRNYVKIENTNTEENTVQNSNTNEATNSNEETNQTTETQTEKTITMKIDGEEIMKTSFDEIITTGKIQLSVGTASKTTSTLQEYISQAQGVAIALDNGNLPLEYQIVRNQYILSDVTEKDLINVEIAILIASLVGIIVLIAKYKLNGLLAGFAYIGLLAIYVLLIKYTNVTISIESIFGIGVILVLNYIFTSMLLKNIDIKAKEKTVSKLTLETYKKFFNTILPICIISIVFCFVKWIPISSFGMILFWGIVIIVVYNAVITRNLLKINIEDK